MFTATVRYCYLDDEPVLMYFLNEIPYTWEELMESSPEIDYLCTQWISYKKEQILKYEQYLIAEKAHPIVNRVDVDNENNLPL